MKKLRRGSLVKINYTKWEIDLWECENQLCEVEIDLWDVKLFF